MLKTAAAVACCAAAATAFVPGPVSMRVPRAALAMSSTPLGVEPLPTAGLEVLAGVDGDLIVDLDSLADDADAEEVMQFEDASPFTNRNNVLGARERWRRHESDSGSPEVQVAECSERVKYLTTHLQNNPKDYNTRRGLIAVINRRRRLLNYLFEQDRDTAMKLVSELGIRFREPGLVPTRAEKYAVYNPQKKTKQELREKRK